VNLVGGLCNRLRALASRRALGPCSVVWLAGEDNGEGRYEDTFEPIDGVTFVTGMPHEAVLRLEQAYNVEPAAPAGWEQWYCQLRLRPAHLARLRALHPGTPYSAMHLRRTDNWIIRDALKVPLTADAEFAAWAAGVPAPIYIATDNGTTQQAMQAACAALGKACIVAEAIPPDDGRDARYTGMPTAAIDLFMCAGSAHFMGTHASSSFSTTAALLRGLPGWWREVVP